MDEPPIDHGNEWVEAVAQYPTTVVVTHIAARCSGDQDVGCGIIHSDRTVSDHTARR